MMRTSGNAAILGALILIAGTGCARAPAPPLPPPPAPPPAPAHDNGWASFRDEFLETYFKADPAFAVSAGRHEFDGRLPDRSAEAIAREIKDLHSQRARTLAFKDSDLSADERFERDSVVAVIDRDLFWLETAQWPSKNPAFYIGTLDPSPYVGREYAPLEVRMRAFIKYEQAVPQLAAQIKANLRAPLARPLLQHGLSAFKGFADYYHKSVPQIFGSVKDPALRKELSDANRTAEEAMRALASALTAERKSANDDFALGADKFTQMLAATERVPTPLAQIADAGKADLARNLEALRGACAQYLPRGSLHACVDKAARDKPTGGVVEYARKQLTELRSFIVSKGVVTIPGSEQILAAQAPPYNRDNFAYIDVPGPYDKGVSSTYFIAPPNPAWPAQMQRDYLPGRTQLLFTSAHEVWPGHFLQFLHSNRYGSIVNRVFVGYAFAEGWAHYGEEMMWEEGYGNGDPEVHIGQLTEALLRNVRLLCAIGLHTQGMKVAECERMFREQAFADAGNAQQQALRGAYDPAYLNYTMGKLMIRKLRADWTKTRGGQSAWREFHDRFLSYGGPPIPMVRAAMMGEDGGSLF
jgi:hypothetical protein